MLAFNLDNKGVKWVTSSQTSHTSPHFEGGLDWLFESLFKNNGPNGLSLNGWRSSFFSF